MILIFIYFLIYSYLNSDHSNNNLNDVRTECYELKNNLDKIKLIVSETWANYNVKTDIRTLKPEPQGAQVIESNLS